ncbi:MAG: hypothetical protein K2I19_07315 [Muribaculaceae bacterium]|nr:hypothetical protein [Muribaculaceae bacterium]
MTPNIKLHNGVEMPLIGQGTYPMAGETLYNALKNALDCGCTLFDTAHSYPNMEVEKGFLSQLMLLYTRNRNGRTEFNVKMFVNDVESARIDSFITRLQSLFSGYQYDQVELGNLELHYRNVIYPVMPLMGYYTHAEMKQMIATTDDICTIHY